MTRIYLKLCYDNFMSMSRTRLTRRLPDHITNELVDVLLNPGVFTFNEVFMILYKSLKEKKSVSGGEEMLRLRTYEKLQNLVSKGFVKKDGKKYNGLERLKNVKDQANKENVMKKHFTASNIAKADKIENILK